MPDSRLATLILLAGVHSCGDASAPSTLALKNVPQLAAQLDTIDFAVASPQLKSLSALALPMLAVGLDFHHMDATVLGRTVEWNAIDQRVFLTTRAGTPSNVLQVTLYKLDATGLPAVTKEEIGYAYLEPLNQFNGGRPDSSSLRFVVFRMPNPTPGVVAEWTAIRLPADTACGQCATINAVMGPVATGSRIIYSTIPYNIPLLGDGSFSGTAVGAGFSFNHAATLPGPNSTAGTATLAFSWQGDSITATSGALHPNAGQLVGDADVQINGTHVATVHRSASGISAVGPDGKAISNVVDRRALGGLFSVPADIADYIEWPTFVLFFCGC